MTKPWVKKRKFRIRQFISWSPIFLELTYFYFLQQALVIILKILVILHVDCTKNIFNNTSTLNRFDISGLGSDFHKNPFVTIIFSFLSFFLTLHILFSIRRDGTSLQLSISPSIINLRNNNYSHSSWAHAICKVLLSFWNYSRFFWARVSQTLFYPIIFTLSLRDPLNTFESKLVTVSKILQIYCYLKCFSNII